MKILQLLEALEVPHAIFSTGTGLIGTDNYIVAHKDFLNILKPLGFVVHKYVPFKNSEASNRSTYLTRNLSREEYSKFKSVIGKYKMFDDENGLVFERTRRPLKEYLPKK